MSRSEASKCLTGQGRIGMETGMGRDLFICPELFHQVVTWQPGTAVHLSWRPFPGLLTLKDKHQPEPHTPTWLRNSCPQGQPTDVPLDKG